MVGADAATSRNRPVLRAIVERGHEIGNHSFEHQPYFHAFSRDRAVADAVRSGYDLNLPLRVVDGPAQLPAAPVTVTGSGATLGSRQPPRTT